MLFWKSDSEHNWHRRLMLCIATLTFTSAFDLKSSWSYCNRSWASEWDGFKELWFTSYSEASQRRIPVNRRSECGCPVHGAVGIEMQQMANWGNLGTPSGTQENTHGRDSQQEATGGHRNKVLGCPWTLWKSKVLWWDQAHLTFRW